VQRMHIQHAKLEVDEGLQQHEEAGRGTTEGLVGVNLFRMRSLQE
jgi:hypothetical protein